MGGRGSAGQSKSGKSALEKVREFYDYRNNLKREAIKNRTYQVEYPHPVTGQTMREYYYGGAWHGKPSSMTGVRQYQPGDFDRLIASQRRRRKR